MILNCDRVLEEMKIVTALDLRPTNLEGLGKQDALGLSLHIEIVSGSSDLIRVKLCHNKE